MFGLVRGWLDRRVIERSAISEAEWRDAFAAVPLLDDLSRDEQARLRELSILFLHRKSVFGARGLEVSQPMQLIIALQACLPILEIGLDAYDGWTSVIVYPSGFMPEHVYTDEYGVEHHVVDELSGEAWQRGPVILAWDETRSAGIVDGMNLVIHEFAHKLDMQNGDANGFPPLHPGMDSGAWTAALSEGFEHFMHRCERGEDIGIDCYAATSPAEFFAVLSEVFFEDPELLNYHYETVYMQFSLYYRQDPMKRLR